MSTVRNVIGWVVASLLVSAVLSHDTSHAQNTPHARVDPSSRVAGSEGTTATRPDAAILARSINLISPNLDETLTATTTWNILWSSTEVANVRIEYYFDGTGWHEIVASTPAATGSYAWVVPETPSWTCRVRISDAADPSLSDQGDALFLIEPSGARHFAPNWSGTPYLPMTINVSMAMIGYDILRWGDEVGVYDGSACVGAVYLEDYPPCPPYMVSTDNPLTPEIDGFIPGHEITYRIWKTGTSQEITSVTAIYEPANPVPLFTSSGSAIVELTGTAPVLPVQLSSFRAAALSSPGVRLEWKTLSETNNYGFEVERSARSISGFAIVQESFIAGQGTTILPQDYAFTDSNAGAGTWFYRLRQIDLDGTVHFSDVVSVTVVLADVNEQVPPEFGLSQNFPNPFNPATTIRFSVSTAGRAVLRVYTMLGEEAGTLFDGIAEAGHVYATVFDARSLPSGVYLCRLTADGKNESRRMLLMR